MRLLSQTIAIATFDKPPCDMLCKATTGRGNLVSRVIVILAVVTGSTIGERTLRIRAAPKRVIRLAIVRIYVLPTSRRCAIQLSNISMICSPYHAEP